MTDDHFKGKAALEHIVEVQAEGKLTSAEIHGAETPGYFFAACDALRETVVAILLISLILSHFEFVLEQLFLVLIAFSAGFIAWKMGRAAWLAWSRLERLHRVMDEEKRKLKKIALRKSWSLRSFIRQKAFRESFWTML